MIALGRLLVASMVLGPLGGGAHHKTEQGNRAYLAEDYTEALRNYTEAQVDVPQSAELYYNIGNVLYRQGDFEGATEAYTRALLAAPEDLVPRAAYNLGNAQFEQKHYPQAIESYERALRSDASDIEAKRNLELAIRARELEQQQKQQQKQDGDEKQEPQEGQERQQGGDSAQSQDGSEKEQQTDPDQDRRGRQNERESAPEQQREPSGKGEEKQTGAAEEAPGQLTQEQADQILAGLEEQEKQNLKEKALQKVPARGRAAEKDW